MNLVTKLAERSGKKKEAAFQRYVFLLKLSVTESATEADADEFETVVDELRFDALKVESDLQAVSRTMELEPLIAKKGEREKAWKESKAAVVKLNDKYSATMERLLKEREDVLKPAEQLSGSLHRQTVEAELELERLKESHPYLFQS